MKRSEDPCRDPASEERDDWAVEPVAASVKERPILFSGPMVRAILDGTKTQTRRIVTDQSLITLHADGSPAKAQPRCKFGQPGDRLWVKETVGRRPASFMGIEATNGVESAYYKADGEDALNKDGFNLCPWFKGPVCVSIHMPRRFSRITLEITAVRVERLQEISEDDAKAEGIRLASDGCYYGSQNFIGHHTAVSAYADLWESINGPGSWEANPFVWVVEFKRL